MSEWMKNLIGFMMIASITVQMLPNRKYEQYVRLFTGFLLVVLVLQPVLKIGTVGEVLERHVAEFVQKQDTLEKQIGIQSDQLFGVETVEEIQVEVVLDD